jgi:anti-sigma regulatory factor (Ser/Thr protein kinase)
MGGPDARRIVLDADTAQVATARRFVRRLLADAVPAEVVDDLQLVTSELFTNAVEHGAAGTVEVVVESTPEFAGVSVVSGGPSSSVGPVIEWRVAGSASLNGRGLGIVRQLADELIVERDADHFAVTARCALAPTN